MLQNLNVKTLIAVSEDSNFSIFQNARAWVFEKKWKKGNFQKMIFVRAHHQMKVVIPSTACREKDMVFSTRCDRASIGRMIKPFGVRRVQISSSKPPILDYTCGEHVVNTR